MLNRSLTSGIGIREFREADSDEALYLSVAMGEGVTIASNVTTIFAREDIAAFPLLARPITRTFLFFSSESHSSVNVSEERTARTSFPLGTIIL